MSKAPLKPYPVYKPAGVPWLQQVPEHWAEIKPKYIFRERVVKGYPNEPLLAATQRMGVVTKETYGERTVTAQKDLHLLKLVEKGDFVISLRSFQGGIEVSHARGIISPAYTILRVARECDPGFLVFLLKSAPFIDGLRLFITGIREGQNIEYARLARTYLPWPPLDEQHLIVRYLHALDAKVKRYSRTKRSLIARLQEQKQAIIQQAVTRGLDPNVKLKPSGVEWLGEVPEHWSLKRFKFVARINKGQVDPRTATYRNLVLIAPNHIQGGTGKLLAHVTANEQGADSGKYLVQKGQVVYSKIRPNLRKVTLAPFDCLCSADMYPISPLEGLLPEFMVLVLLSPQFTKFAVDTSMRAAMPKINREDLANCWLWFPDTVEQEEILEAVKRESVPYDKAISFVEGEVTHMIEYHTRLIADVVTGAVDVRATAQAMPDQIIDGSDDQMMEEEVLEDLGMEAEETTNE